MQEKWIPPFLSVRCPLSLPTQLSWRFLRIDNRLINTPVSSLGVPSFTSFFAIALLLSALRLVCYSSAFFLWDYYQNWIAFTALMEIAIFSFYATAVNAKWENTFSLPNNVSQHYCLKVRKVSGYRSKKESNNGRKSSIIFASSQCTLWIGCFKFYKVSFSPLQIFSILTS